MRLSLFPVIVATALVLAACETEQPLLEPDPPLFEEFEGGETWYEDDTYDQHRAFIDPADSIADSGEPLWLGETQPFGGVEFECPRSMRGVDWAVRHGATYERIEFDMGWIYMIYYQGPAPSGTIGVPGGRYSAPNTWHSYSRDGQYKAWGGNLYGECHGQYVRTRLGFRVWVGFMRWYAFDGAIEALYTGNGGTESGWSASHSSNLTGQGSDWEAALAAYLNEGRCTPGWQIFVDGGMVCDGEE